jgi:hypothetical protein
VHRSVQVVPRTVSESRRFTFRLGHLVRRRRAGLLQRLVDRGEVECLGKPVVVAADDGHGLGHPH